MLYWFSPHDSNLTSIVMWGGENGEEDEEIVGEETEEFRISRSE